MGQIKNIKLHIVTDIKGSKYTCPSARNENNLLRRSINNNNNNNNNISNSLFAVMENGMFSNGNSAFPDLPNVDVPLPDWEYTMRRTMQEIVPNVFLGPYRAAVRSKFDYLKEHGITHIIRNFSKVKEFIDECMSMQGKILMHGDGGMSRSAALMIAYMMETYGLPYKEAFGYVQQRRYCINPNGGFIRQLMEYEPIYMARFQQNNQHMAPSARCGLKRPHGSDDEMEESPKRDR